MVGAVDSVAPVNELAAVHITNLAYVVLVIVGLVARHAPGYCDCEVLYIRPLALPVARGYGH